MTLAWSARAQSHLQALHAYIAKDNPRAAADQVRRIIDLCERVLIAHPQSGRPGRVSGTRELVVSNTPYVVAYQADDETVTILAVLHNSRRWPTRF